MADESAGGTLDVRICPFPDAWQAAHGRLEGEAELRDCTPPAPPTPLILNGWVISNDVEKVDRWKETIAWAERNGCRHVLDDIPEEHYYLVHRPLGGDVTPLGRSVSAGSHEAERSSARWAVLGTIAALITLLGVQLGFFGLDMGDWDFLFVSGALTLICALWAARGQPPAFGAMAGRLISRGHLTPRGSASELVRELEQRETRWAKAGGVLGAALIAATFVVVTALRGGPEAVLVAVLGPIAGALGGFLAGRVIGRMILYSQLPRSVIPADQELRKGRLRLSVAPGHPDRAAGLKPLGDFFFVQALLLSIPAVFLFAWTLLFFLPAFDERYGAWRSIYIGLFLLAIVIEIGAVVVPLWRVHVAMKAEKARLASDADDRARAVTEIKGELERELKAERREELKDRLSEVTDAYYAIERMTTWPFDPSVRRWLTLGNGALIISLISQAAGLLGFS